MSTKQGTWLCWFMVDKEKKQPQQSPVEEWFNQLWCLNMKQCFAIIFKDYIYLLFCECMCVCVCVCACTRVYQGNLQRSEDSLWEPILFSHHLRTRDQAHHQTWWQGGKHIYLWDDQSVPFLFCFFFVFFFFCCWCCFWFLFFL